ncbi:efflux transporter outer membrane subunit [Pseudomonas luteola]
MKSSYTRLSLSIALAALMSGCASQGTDVISLNDLPHSYKASVNGESRSETHKNQWWEALNDRELDELVSKAHTFNSDVRIASTQILAAQAKLRGSEASFFPVLDLALSGSKGRMANAQAQSKMPVMQSVTGQMQLSYELDIFGKLSDARNSSFKALQATQYDKQAIELAVKTSVIEGYLKIREYDQLIDQYQELYANAKENEEIVSLSVTNGLATGMDLKDAQILTRTQMSMLEQHKADRKLAENALALLVGDQSLTIKADQRRYENVLPTVNPGVPSSLLENRPDVQKALATLESANANVLVAKKAFFPQISLTGSSGQQSSALSSLIGGNNVWSIGYGLDLPLFDGGLRMSNLWQSKAEREQAVEMYKSTVQTAFKEVNDAIVSLNAQSAIFEQAKLANGESVERLSMHDSEFKSGLISYKRLLDAKNTHIENNIKLVEDHYAYLNQWVVFNKSLGIGNKT